MEYFVTYAATHAFVSITLFGGVFCGTIDDPPDNTAALIETSTHLNCTVNTLDNDIEWSHTLDGATTRIHTINAGVLVPEDYDVHVHGIGHYDLEVKSVRQALSGDLTCLPEEGTQEIEKGQLAVLECETEVFGYKKPKLEFSATQGRIENQYTDATPKDEETEEEDHIVRQIANFTVFPEHNEMRFECRLSFEKEEEQEPEPPTYTDSCSTYFYVLHPPQNIELYPPPESFPDDVILVRVGDWINCSASARPDPMYEWKDLDDTEYYHGQDLVILEEMIPPEGESSERDYRCIVTNEINGQPQTEERVFKFRIASTTTAATTPPSAPGPTTNTGLIVGMVVTSLVILTLVAGAILIYWRRQSSRRGKCSSLGIGLLRDEINLGARQRRRQDTNLAHKSNCVYFQKSLKNLHPQHSRPRMVDGPGVGTSQDGVSVISNNMLSVASTYNTLERSPDDFQSTTPVYTVLGGIFQQGTEYEEIPVEGCECTADAVELDTLLHSGKLCEVYTGIIKELKGHSRGMRVVVKKNKVGTTVLEQTRLIDEIKALQTVGKHPNIVQFLGQCLSEDPVMSVCALETPGDLKNYLQEIQGHSYVNNNLQQMFIGFALGVASGMAHLSGIKPDIIHRRLAAEHVLVGEKQVCKVIGFGFAEHIVDREKYERTQGIEPEIRWMAPEQLALKDHTKKSDVWAFGVLMWEVFSGGEVPYAGLSSLEVKQLILSGGALGMPEGTIDGVFDVMLNCWNMDEQKRPDFNSLREVLKTKKKADIRGYSSV